MYIIIIFYNIIFYYISKFFYMPQGCHTENLAKISLSLAFSLSLALLFFLFSSKLTVNSPRTENSYDNNLCQVMAIFMAIASPSWPSLSPFLAPS